VLRLTLPPWLQTELYCDSHGPDTRIPTIPDFQIEKGEMRGCLGFSGLTLIQMIISSPHIGGEDVSRYVTTTVLMMQKEFWEVSDAPISHLTPAVHGRVPQSLTGLVSMRLTMDMLFLSFVLAHTC
jgi:hypothetical protein